MKLFRYIFLPLLLLGCCGCSGVSYQYKGPDDKIHFEMRVPAGAGRASFSFGTNTNSAFPIIESDYPTVLAYYSSAPREANNLRNLEVILKVDGQEIQADTEVFAADYANTYLELEKKDCCVNLGERLGIDPTLKDDPFGFSVHITKKYKSLKRLPPQITVVLLATTDKGTTEMTKTLNLESYEDSGFIRVH